MQSEIEREPARPERMAGMEAPAGRPAGADAATVPLLAAGPAERMVRQILERVESRGAVRVETVPARWPMTRHRVRAVAERLIAEGLLQREPGGAVRLTPAGRALLAGEAA